MVSFDEFRSLALSFPEATEKIHFQKTSFRVKNKIFATYDESMTSACIKLSAIDHNVFSVADHTTIFKVDNKWGYQGWTLIKMKSVNIELFIDALTGAYCEVAPTKLVEQLTLLKKISP